ncbi:F54H12.3-like protein, partial [Acromyrmex echinatior]
ILTVIDILSKYAWALPLKSKNRSDVAAALSKIFREDERYPRNLQTDQGKEFYNTIKDRQIKERNFTTLSINHYSTYSMMKASIVERFNRTLKNNMWKTLTLNGSYKWIDELLRLLSDYNHPKHRTIEVRPIDVTSVVAKRLLSTVYSRVKIAAPTKFKIGDPVRISKFKTIFEKGYTPNWSTEIFYIVKIQRTNPAKYLLKDYQGKPMADGFYEHEFQRVSNPVYLVEKILRKRRNKVYVKWLGMDSSHNS